MNLSMFDFIKYIKPLWYYRLAYKMPHSVLLNKGELDQLVNADVLTKGGFKNEHSLYMDLAYQALNSGYIPQGDRSAFQDLTVTNVQDNYRFVYRQFGKSKAIYVLCIRLISFKNPLKEIISFKRATDLKVKINPKDWDTQSVSLNSLVKVSVVIPTLNRYEYLKDVLADLEKQTYKNFDVWICDQSEPFNGDFYQGWNLKLNVIEQQEKALWYARNRCIESSDSEYLLFFDDDSRVEPDWIEAHLQCCKHFNCLISAGTTHTIAGGGNSVKSEYYHSSEVLDTGNVLIHRSVFDLTALFDIAFERMRMGDGEFGLRCLLNGCKVISNPVAKRIHLKVQTGGLRQMGAWDAIHNIGLLKPKPIPSALYFARKHFDKSTTLIYGLTQLPKACLPYSKKKSKPIQKLPYYFLSFLLAPILLFTFYRSWKISSKLLIIQSN
jgi:glycosyltransferase involved in cell wall biosynthesis